jgi:hypothetical protein
MRRPGNRPAGDMTQGETLLIGMSDRLIRALPPAFLLLVILNIVFLGVASYVFAHNTEVRNTMITKILDTCLQKQQ